jgi:DNA-binding NarL/FixJ family response regulator
VAKHRTNLMEKLEMKNMATLVRYAIRIGVVDVDSDYGAGS